MSSTAAMRADLDDSAPVSPSDVISAVSNPELGLRLRAIHASARLSPSLSLPILLTICKPNNPCQTTAWLSFAELCNVVFNEPSVLNQVLPTLMAMSSSISLRCSRTARIPLNRLITSSNVDANSKQLLSSLATTLNIEFIATKKRGVPGPTTPRPASRNQAEDRLVHERLDILPMPTQIELILRCARLNLPNIQPSTFKEGGEAFHSLFSLLHEQLSLIRDPRLRDPRLRGTLAVPDAEADVVADVQLVKSAFDRMDTKPEPLPASSASVLVDKKIVPEIPVAEFSDQCRRDLIDASFSRMMVSCSRSRVTEAVISQMIAKFDQTRIDPLLELFRKSPIDWLNVVLQLGFALIARGLTSLYTSTIMHMIESMWTAPTGTLSKVLCTCPLLPNEALDAIDKTCISENDVRRTVALFALRDVILQRPADRSKILDLLLKYAGSTNSALRKPAVALITHQLLPLGNTVEDAIILFANRLFSTMSEPFEVEIEERVKVEFLELKQAEQKSQQETIPDDQSSHGSIDTEPMEIDESRDPLSPSPATQQDSTVDEERSVTSNGDVGAAETSRSDSTPQIIIQDGSEMGSETAADTTKVDEVSEESRAGSLIEEEASRRLELFFALCSKRHDLFPAILSQFALVSSRGTRVRACIHKNILRLVRTIGPGSPALIQAIKHAPHGSEPLVLHVLHILTDGVEDLISPALVEAAHSCYSESRDARFLIPVMSGMKRMEVLESLPHLVALPKVHVEQALKLMLGSRSPVSPSEVLVRLHIIAPTPDHPLLRKVMDATQFCIFNKEAYNEKVLAVVLQQIVERNPIPVLFMRTLIQVLAVYPLLTEFAISILAKLISKRIWDMPNLELWQGFVVCCMRTAPNSFPIMLQLPSSRLAQIIEGSKDPNKLRLELARFVQNSRIVVRRSIQSVIGLSRRLR